MQTQYSSPVLTSLICQERRKFGTNDFYIHRGKFSGESHFRNWHWLVHTKTLQLMSLSYEIPNHNYVLQHWFKVIQSILKNIQPKLHAPVQREGNF